MRFNGDQFTISTHPTGIKTLVAEASTILQGQRIPTTLAIKSQRTGKVVRFTHTHTDYNGEDVAGWRYEPMAADATRVPGANLARVLIIND